MSSKYLHRDDAPFGDSVWDKIDETVTTVARRVLAGRRLLTVEGPYGPELQAVALYHEDAAEGQPVAPCCLPLVTLQAPFRLQARAIAAFEQGAQPLALKPVADAALACARQEDTLVFRGHDGLNVRGLMNLDGALSVPLRQQDEVGALVETVTQAVTQMDQAGVFGPYALALAPGLYNRLYRKYPQGPMTELEHVRQIATGGVVKATVLEQGGLLVAASEQYGTLVLGQDMTTGFIGPDGTAYEFLIVETIALNISTGAAVCELRAEG